MSYFCNFNQNQMKKLFQNKTFITAALLALVLSVFLIWGTSETEKTIGLVSIPEFKASQILKSVHFEEDSLVQEIVTVTYDFETLDITNYILIKFRNSTKNLNELFDPQKFTSNSSPSQNVFGVKVWDYQSQAKEIDFKYNYTQSPISETELSDTILIQRFDEIDQKIQISLTQENTVDLEYSILKKFLPTFVFYKRNTDMYLIIAYRLNDTVNKWVTDEELKKTLYLLVKNWGVYEKR